MRVGIVGYGVAGRYFHGPTIKAAGGDVSAIVTKNTLRRSAAREDFPEALLLTSIEELLAEDLDLIVIASSNQVRFEHSRRVIEAKVALVVDKPFALNLEETDEILNLAQHSNVPITCFFNRIWDSDTLTAERVIRSAAIGEIFRFESRYERFRPELNLDSWRENFSHFQGGGLLLDLGPHLLSTSLRLFGSAELKFASLKQVRRGSSIDDLTLILEHTNGVLSHLHASSITGSPGPRIRMSGSEGELIIEELDRQEALLRKGRLPDRLGWPESDEISSAAQIVQGDRISSLPAEPGNYVAFYSELFHALENSHPLPVRTQLIREVAILTDAALQYCGWD